MSLGMKSGSLPLSQVSKRFLVALMLMFTLLSTEKTSVSAATAIFYEPFTQGWAPGTAWSLATGASYEAKIVDESTQTPPVSGNVRPLLLARLASGPPQTLCQ